MFIPSLFIFLLGVHQIKQSSLQKKRILYTNVPNFVAGFTLKTDVAYSLTYNHRSELKITQ